MIYKALIIFQNFMVVIIIDMKVKKKKMNKNIVMKMKKNLYQKMNLTHMIIQYFLYQKNIQMKEYYIP